MLWFLLEFGVSDELVGGEYSTCVQVESRGSCHFWGGGGGDGLASGPPARPFPSTPLRVNFGAQGERPHPGRGWIPARRGVRLQEGWVPASAGMTEGGGGGGSIEPQGNVPDLVGMVA